MNTGPIDLVDGTLKLFVRYREPVGHDKFFGEEPAESSDPKVFLARKPWNRSFEAFQFVTRFCAMTKCDGREIVLRSEIQELSPVYWIGKFVNRSYLEQVRPVAVALGAQDPSFILDSKHASPDDRILEVSGGSDDHYAWRTNYDDRVVVDRAGAIATETVGEISLPQVLILTNDARWNGPYLSALYGSDICVRHVRYHPYARNLLNLPIVARHLRMVMVSLFENVRGGPADDPSGTEERNTGGLSIHEEILRRADLKDIDCVVLTCSTNQDLAVRLQKAPRTTFIRTGPGPHYRSPAEVVEFARKACL